MMMITDQRDGDYEQNPLHQLDTEMVFWIPFDYAVSHQVGRRLTPQSMSSHHHHHNPHHPHHHSGVCHVPQHNWSGPCSRATCRGEKQRVQKAGRGKNHDEGFHR